MKLIRIFAVFAVSAFGTVKSLWWSATNSDGARSQTSMALAAERERCAKVAEAYDWFLYMVGLLVFEVVATVVAGIWYALSQPARFFRKH